MNDKYLIVAAYDNGYGFELNDCGRTEVRDLEDYSENATEVYRAYLNNDIVEFERWLLNNEKYKDYNFIVVVVDAYIKVVKDEVFKEKERR